jgi:hypothetical protein
MQFCKRMLMGFIVVHSTFGWALPEDSDFATSSEFPVTASFGWAGTTLPDGRYTVWDGNTVYAQAALGVDSWRAVVTGYAGDPAFMIPIPNSAEYLLGAGFSGDIYRVDWSNPVDYTPAVAGNIGGHS